MAAAAAAQGGAQAPLRGIDNGCGPPVSMASWIHLTNTIYREFSVQKV